MFIKKLIISTPRKVIRNIEFHKGLNLIVDDTPTINTQLTGNNVGKTTVLKLVDFCLGGEANEIYIDFEDKKSEYEEVKKFLIEQEVLITLILTEDLDSVDKSKQIIIERNFLPRSRAIRNINGEPILDKDFENKLMSLLIPNQKSEKPSFRQIISHNIRYKDENINNTLKTLSKYTSDSEYETLYLFLLGCNFNNGAKRQAILTKLKQEENYKNRLEKNQSKESYEIALTMLDNEILELNKKKKSFNINENFEKDLDELNKIKYRINKISSEVVKLGIRKDLIEEAKENIENSTTNIDLKQLKELYDEAKLNVSGIQKTFEDLVSYHNTMIVEKLKFITEDLPSLNEKIKLENIELNKLLEEEKTMSEKIAKSDSFEELEKTITNINEKYRLKGEYENTISYINEVEENIKRLKNELSNIDNYLFSNEFKELLKLQITKFNKFFSAISNELYGESYVLGFSEETNKKNQTFYKFSSFNLNMSSGKKQGEILCFDLAYILFADSEKIPCLHFLLNDKKELMHDNQLLKVADFVKKNNIQLIISILKDKLPEELVDKSNIVVELSQNKKLFRIEEFNKI
ncbi:Uncharacterized protein conserved in bacteria (DUF2326) [Fusobacterium polymorphum]|uniref:DUF2326 domain-containing protein n=1 Tax=Fusobacterium polymorphum ATCC 10953 TaxID=393480 RepID=A5TY28_FUSNP|nr:DUF2326 domain-containing protein [Fusobacterium polymorphum]EDK89803.1 hypothetical protein FNP_2037 [Fusobacterium polymorphum ATCC 10953]UTI52715.1 DUF2326 domain-containing protein [Fusobacterium polymorphum]WRL69459.1 DUF2326 domain-containing protein [Fusobacterium polymorphum]CKH11497.1 Uncharacterized protein conserved in bacteria (DUF2326) [Fusobacterium polymorphum]